LDQSELAAREAATHAPSQTIDAGSHATIVDELVEPVSELIA
jgi:hypothetical protein